MSGRPERESSSSDPVELQAELLRYRARLIDPGTGLPTLPLVVERVRRLLDADEILKVFVIEIEQEQDLEQSVGWEKYDRYLGRVAERLSAVARSVGEESVVLSVERVRGDRFFVFAAGSRVGADLAAELSRSVPVDGSDGAGESGCETIALRIGEDVIRRSPVQRVERTIYAGIGAAQNDLVSRVHVLDQDRRESLTRVLRDRRISVLFQPIVRVPHRTVIGYEALSRGPRGTYLESADKLFGFAAREGMRGEVELLCVERALASAHRLPISSSLFINLSFAGLEFVEGERGGLTRLVRQSGWSPREFVLEITEHTYAQDPDLVSRWLLDLRRQGFRLAVDDVGTGYSSLHMLADLRPDYLKLDHLLVRDLHNEAIKRNLISAITEFARKSQSLVIGEGVERAEEVSALQELGVNLLQGFYFEAPQEL